MAFDSIFEEVAESFFLKKGSKIVKEETLEEYLNSFTREELLRLYFVRLFLSGDVEGIKNVKKVSNKKIVNLIKDNLYEVLDYVLCTIKYEYIEQLKIVVNSKVDKMYDLKFDFLFIGFLKNFSIAKVEYNSDEGYFKFFMPNEFRKIFNKLLNNKNIIKDIKLASSVYNFVENVLSTYGVIDLDTLYNIVNTKFIKIDEEDFEFILFCKSFSEEFYIYLYNDTKIVCNTSFNKKCDAIEFYKDKTMDYKIYNSKEYELIASGEYVEKLSSFKKLKKYLLDNFIDEEDFKEIKIMLIIDYIYSAQRNIDVADSNFKKNIVRYFDIDSFMIEYLLNMLKNIYNEYPKWSKRGNV